MLVCILQAGKPAETFGIPEVEQRNWTNPFFSLSDQSAPVSSLQSCLSFAACSLGWRGMIGREVQTRREKHTIRRGVWQQVERYVLQPTKFWKLKHPTDTELLNVTEKERQKNHPATLWWSKDFFVFKNLIKTSTEAVYSQAARTQCVQYIAKKQTALTMISPFFTVLWHSVGVLYLFTKMHSAAKSFKNTSNVAMTGSGIKRKKKKETLGLQVTLPRAAAVSARAH